MVRLVCSSGAASRYMSGSSSQETNWGIKEELQKQIDDCVLEEPYSASTLPGKSEEVKGLQKPFLVTLPAPVEGVGTTYTIATNNSSSGCETTTPAIAPVPHSSSEHVASASSKDTSFVSRLRLPGRKSVSSQGRHEVFKNNEQVGHDMHLCVSDLCDQARALTHGAGLLVIVIPAPSSKSRKPSSFIVPCLLVPSMLRLRLSTISVILTDEHGGHGSSSSAPVFLESESARGATESFI